jgi:hypothetical protein
VTWFPRLPFRAVLPHVAAVVHHGGIGTLTEALAAGTPQVILAHGADRPDNAERLARRGLASWLPAARWTPQEVGRLLAVAVEDDPTGVNDIDDGPAARVREGRLPPLSADVGLRAAAACVERLPGMPDTAESGGRARPSLDRLSPEQRRVVAERLRGRLARRGAR